MENLAKFEDYLKIYTDGSKSQEGVGCSFLIPLLNYDEKIKLSEHATIFSAEAHAIIEAMKYVLNNKVHKALILTDSKSVVESLSNLDNILKSLLIGQIYKIYQQILKANLIINILWIKAHCGLEYNEQVDRLAKESIINSTKAITEIPYSDLIPLYKIKARKEWEQIYENAYNETTTNYFLIHPKLPTKHWFHNLHISRQFYTTITRLKFNHGRFPSHLFKIKIRNDNLCTCGQVGDINHIVFNCVQNQDHCKVLMDNLIELGFQTPLNVNNILASENFDACTALYIFFKSTNILV